MLGYFPQVYIMLTAVISQQYYGQACETGWFGEYCRYMCHCRDSTVCDESTGECPNHEPCEYAYFGPGCQFIDMVSYETQKSVPEFLRDSNDTTCNPDTHATSVELVQKKQYGFSFVRIVVNDNSSMLNFTMTLNDAVPCSAQRIFKITNTVVDVTCDITLQLRKLRIDGAIAGSICSVYISGGRNVALRQNTSQTSTDSGGQSSKAVDGNIEESSSIEHCSATQRTNDRLHEWTLTLSRPQIIYEINIYNRRAYEYRLRGFKINTFDKNGSLVFSHVDKSKYGFQIYWVPVHSQTPVTTLKITLPSGAIQLVLCEVRLFADDVCNSNTYGLYCQHPCQCDKTEVCHFTTGACAKGCSPGFFGFKCLSSCSVNCRNGICDWSEGHCIQCTPGYIGDICNSECDPGTYGENCTYNCSERCADTCNHIHGACHCKRGFTGPECKYCASTFYGELCENNCSVRCLDRLCERYTGMCFSCVEGYQGNHCEYGSIIIWLMLIPLVLLVGCLCFFAAIAEREFPEDFSEE